MAMFFLNCIYFIRCRKRLKERLGVPSEVQIGYQVHDDTISKTSSVTRTKYAAWPTINSRKFKSAAITLTDSFCLSIDTVYNYYLFCHSFICNSDSFPQVCHGSLLYLTVFVTGWVQSHPFWSVPSFFYRLFPLYVMLYHETPGCKLYFVYYFVRFETPAF